MKKFGKFVLGALSVAAVAGGAFYFLKNVVNKESNDDFDDFDDDFDDFDDFDVDEELVPENDAREYVTINIQEEQVPEQSDEAEPQQNTEPESDNDNSTSES